MPRFLATSDPATNNIRLILLLVVVLFAGVILGIGGKPAPSTVASTPQSCLEYIEHSEQGFDYAGESMGYAADAMDAVSRFNFMDIDDASKGLKGMKPKLDALAPKLLKAKADCKDGK